jgi:acetyl esterase/lipase
MTTAPHPALDPELARVLESFGGSATTVTRDRIAEMRSTTALFRPSDDDLSRGGSIRVSRRSVPGPQGAPEVTLLICQPADQQVPAPAVYYLHPGGMIMGECTTGLEVVLDWVQEQGVVAISVEYRLAPEHPDPAPIEDCYAGLVWAAEHAADLHVDVDRMLVAGNSAGGGLAAGLALLSRDRHGPDLSGQILMSPMLDDRNVTGSSHELHGEGVWDRESNLTGWTALLGDRRGGEDVSSYAAPARATDLSGLPSTFIDIGSVETFRDETIEYAIRLWAVGGSAELHVWSGAFHAFDLMAPNSAIAKAAGAARLNWLRRLLQI